MKTVLTFIVLKRFERTRFAYFSVPAVGLFFRLREMMKVHFIISLVNVLRMTYLLCICGIKSYGVTWLRTNDLFYRSMSKT